MTWGLAQAGNGTGRTGRYLHWWESEPEWNAATSALQNPYDAASFFTVVMLRMLLALPLLLLPLLLRYPYQHRLVRYARLDYYNVPCLYVSKRCW